MHPEVYCTKTQVVASRQLSYCTNGECLFYRADQIGISREELESWKKSHQAEPWPSACG
jgi:hypothetical protein